MQASKQIEQKLWRVAYQGGPGCHSERAATKLLGQPFDGRPFASFAETTAAVANGQVDFVLVPVFNTTTGFIAPALNAIRDAGLTKVKTIKLGVDHQLIAHEGVNLDAIREVWAHRQVYLQCSKWIEKSGVKVRIVDDIACCVDDYKATQRQDLALLGPVGVGYATGLYAASGPLQDDTENATTFWLLK
ncbi:MAG: prephenate dehydratase domain-containing protein [Planctomycetota bacterium]|jgi:chorismate mutase/prephenate dehydratase